MEEIVIFPLSLEQAPYENFAEFVRKSGSKADNSVRRTVETDTIDINITRITPQVIPVSSGLSGRQTQFGGLAQLGERLHGMQEVRGSTPLSSTFKSSKSQ